MPEAIAIWLGPELGVVVFWGANVQNGKVWPFKLLCINTGVVIYELNGISTTDITLFVFGLGHAATEVEKGGIQETNDLFIERFRMIKWCLHCQTL